MGGNKSDTMAKVQHFSGISKRIPFEGIDFYDLFRVTFKNSERGRKSFFSPEGKVALMFLKMYTQLSTPKLLEMLNGNVHYQIFCDVYVASGRATRDQGDIRVI